MLGYAGEVRRGEERGRKERGRGQRGQPVRVWPEGAEQQMEELKGGGDPDHLSATAAAMGARMDPRAVAASSSISVFKRLMTHSIASRPWSKAERDSGMLESVLGGREGRPTRLCSEGDVTLLALTEMVFAMRLSR